MYQSETGAASTEVQRPIVPYYEVDGEVHMASSDIEAFLDCARYNEEGDTQLLKMYLNAHPEYINLTDSQGRTAIHMASANNHVKLLEIMMMYHPQPNKVNQEGNTALHFAALNNSIDARKEKTFASNARDENEEEVHHLPSTFDPKASKTLYFGSINMDDVE